MNRDYAKCYRVRGGRFVGVRSRRLLGLAIVLGALILAIFFGWQRFWRPRAPRAAPTKVVTEASVREDGQHGHYRLQDATASVAMPLKFDFYDILPKGTLTY